MALHEVRYENYVNNETNERVEIKRQVYYDDSDLISPPPTTEEDDDFHVESSGATTAEPMPNHVENKSMDERPNSDMLEEASSLTESLTDETCQRANGEIICNRIKCIYINLSFLLQLG